MKHLVWALMLCGLLSTNALAAGSEARCDALSTNCICSEPLNTNSYSIISTYWYNPNDTTTKECAVEGVAQGAMEVSGGFGSAISTGAAITALPAAHTNTYVYQAPPDSTTSNFYGTTIPGGQPTARRAIRWYQYYSSDYSFTNDVATCNAGKIAQFGPSAWLGPLFVSQGIWTFYDVQISTGFNSDNDCCQGAGPGNTDTGPNTTDTKGKWWRIEIITHNAATTGAGTTFDMYIKNVTDNGAELHVLDTSQTQNTAGNIWNTAAATNLHPTSQLDFYSVNMFRGQTGGGPANCTGYAAYSHLLVAAWSTDAGQRIGAAVEIEGSGTPPPSRFSPSINLRRAQLPSDLYLTGAQR